MYTGKRINKQRAYAIYGIAPLALLCAFVWGCGENEFPPAEEKALSSYTLKLSTSEIAAGELAQIPSLDAYVFGDDEILKEIIHNIPVSDGTIQVQANQRDYIYFVSNPHAEGLYKYISAMEGKVERATVLAALTPKIDPDKGEIPLLFYSAGPFAIGSGESLKLKRSLARIDLKIQDNVKVSKITFEYMHLQTSYFPSTLLDDGDGSYIDLGERGSYTKTFDEPVSGNVENVYSLYVSNNRYDEIAHYNEDGVISYEELEREQWVDIYVLYGDSEEPVSLKDKYRLNLRNNYIHTLLIKDINNSSVFVTQELSPWEKGNGICIEVAPAIRFWMSEAPEVPGVELDKENFSVTIREIQEGHQLTFTLAFNSYESYVEEVAYIGSSYEGRGIRFGNRTLSKEVVEGTATIIYKTSYDFTIPASMLPYTAEFAVGIPSSSRELKIHVPGYYDWGK